MVLIFYVFLNLLALFLFTKQKKKLHILEIIIYWMVASYLYQNFSALCYMNFKTLQIPNKFPYELSHFTNRIILFPLIMVTFLNLYVSLNTLIRRLALILCFTFILSGFEWLADFFGVIKHVHWKLWWSFSLWFLGLLVLISFLKIFRKILYKGDLYS